MFRFRFARPRTHPVTRLASPVAAFAAVALLAATISSASAAATASLKPVADTWVNSTSASTNYGTQTVLRVDGSPVFMSYLRFDLSGSSGTVSRAVLQLYANSANAAGLSVHKAASTTWGETTTTAANAPAMGSASVSSGPVAAGKTASIDVTSLVSGHALVSLGLTDNDTTAISLGSRESAHPPVLLLTLAPVATPTPKPTATPVPTATPSSPPTSTNPVRAAFYYPWFPEAWNQSGMNPFTHYHPSLGFYDGASPTVIANHIKAMQ